MRAAAPPPPRALPATAHGLLICFAVYPRSGRLVSGSGSDVWTPAHANGKTLRLRHTSVPGPVPQRRHVPSTRPWRQRTAHGAEAAAAQRSPASISQTTRAPPHPPPPPPPRPPPPPPRSPPLTACARPPPGRCAACAAGFRHTTRTRACRGRRCGSRGTCA